MSPEKQRIGIAAAIAPLAVIPAIFCDAVCVLVHAQIVSDSSETVAGSFGAFLVTSMFGVPIAYMLVVGVPAALCALKIGRAHLLLAILAGGVVGAATAVVLKGGKFEFPSLLFMVWNGVVVGGAFYFLAKRRGGSSTTSATYRAG
jgi:hypothetical protein